MRLAGLINLKRELSKSINITGKYFVKFFTWDAHPNGNSLCFYIISMPVIILYRCFFFYPFMHHYNCQSILLIHIQARH
ncbi:hypothetical protein B7H17_06645 [Pseudomonas putida]|uniref:Uncharacterized protein n=1 Tax=Pseudomonas putida TaxID=303 RepID=A0A1X1A2M5_PSEPU|nr:hypothetical protein B7H17_06645 [Pseudomonas putida]